MRIDIARFGPLARFYRRHLCDEVMGFWDKHSPDREHGGFVHTLDRRGNWTWTNKNIWCQGRMTYMYSALHRQIEPRSQWLELAKLGRDFLVEHAYAGNGRWHYLLDRKGAVVVDNRSLFTDGFALMGLCEYASASGSNEDFPIICATFEAMQRNLRTPSFKEFHHFNLDPNLLWHSPQMIVVGLAEVIRPVLGQHIEQLVDECLNQVLYTFAKDDHRVLFEVLKSDGQVLESDQGLSINPGHSLECLWFCMEEGLRRGDRKIVDRAAQVMDWAYCNGADTEYRGILNTTHACGGKPPGPEQNAWGERWDYKVWWVHTESLYALALAAVETQSSEMLRRFLDLHDYTFKVFPDSEYGEWYEYLTRDGSVVYHDKAKWIKSAFHLPRNLMKLTLLMDRATKSEPQLSKS